MLINPDSKRVEIMVQERIENLPYRDSVSCIVFKDNRFLLVQLAGWPDNWWKFPQGGIEEGETEETAAKRELLEELGSGNFKIIAESSHIHQYDWPIESVKKAGHKWSGQIQKFFLVEFLGKDKEIQINKKEIQQYKWVDGLDDLFKSIDHNSPLFVNYKNAVERVLETFKML